MANPNDAIRDAILRHMYDVNRQSRSPKKAAIGIRDLNKGMKAKHGYKQQEVSSNLIYLIEIGWVSESLEQSSFSTPGGAVRTQEKRSYRISASGIDRLEAASTYERTPASQSVNITNIQGVTVVGDGNVVNTTFTDLAHTLDDIINSITDAPCMTQQDKLEIISDIGSLQSQLQKPNPSKEIVRALWGQISNAVTAAGITELIANAETMIAPLLA